jgi:protein-tyrosine phosphatase
VLSEEKKVSNVSEVRPHVTGLTGVFNFRDLGGLETVDGGTIVPGAVFRSDALDELSANDVRLLCDSLGVRTLIDLRAHIETSGNAPAWAAAEAVDILSLPLSDDWEGWGELDDDSRRTLLSRKYASYLDVAGHNVISALERIAGDAGARPVVVHCAVGKDRTGVVVAILLSLLKVRREQIVADYVTTASNMAPIMERLAASETYAHRVLTNPPEVYMAEEHTITQFLDAVDSEFGGAEPWAVQRGLSEPTLARLRERLVRRESESGDD